MTRKFLLLLAAVLLGAGASHGDPPKPPADPMPEAKNPGGGLPVGKWTVEFANGVVETVEVKADGTASVTEPLRTAEGKAVVQGGAATLAFEDDRTERWTPVGKKFVVEHWFPASRLPATTTVLGIAEPAK